MACAAKTSRVADRPMLVIELAQVVWRDTVAVLESDDGCDDSTPRPVGDGCDDSMRRPCSEYEARAFLASELAQRQLIRMHALAEDEAAAEPGETAAAAERAAAPRAAPRAARSKRPRDQNDTEAGRASIAFIRCSGWPSVRPCETARRKLDAQRRRRRRRNRRR